MLSPYAEIEWYRMNNRYIYAVYDDEIIRWLTVTGLWTELLVLGKESFCY
jgi:hypothetical protein